MPVQYQGLAYKELAKTGQKLYKYLIIVYFLSDFIDMVDGEDEEELVDDRHEL